MHVEIVESLKNQLSTKKLAILSWDMKAYLTYHTLTDVSISLSYIMVFIEPSGKSRHFN